MNNNQIISRADFIGLSALLSAYTLQDYVALASLFAFVATGIYYLVKTYNAITKRHD